MWGRALSSLPRAGIRLARAFSLARTPLTSKEVAQLFSVESRIQSWLDVEAHMAQAQGCLGVIPQEAAAEIARAAADIRGYDLAALAADTKQTHSPVLSLVRMLASKCRGSAGSYVHWGATTENIIITGLLLQTRQAHGEILTQLAAAIEAACLLADEPLGYERVCAGRTVQRQALPTTWGFRISVFIEELARHGERLLEAEDRLFRISFGGAIGAFHALDGDDRTSTELGKRLGMRTHLVQVRSSFDSFSEYLALLGLLSSTVTRISNELYALMGNELGEVKELLDDHVIGSSTMAAKVSPEEQEVNPKYAPSVLALASQLRAACVLPALEIVQPSHQGDSACSVKLHRTMTAALPLAHKLLHELAELLHHVEPDDRALERNLRLSEPGSRVRMGGTACRVGGGSLLCTEHAVMRLGAATAERPDGMGGRQWALAAVSRAAARAVRDDSPLADTLLEDPTVRTALPEAELRAMLQPRNYLGASAAVARAAVTLGRQAAGSLRASAAATHAAQERVQVIKYRLNYKRRSINGAGSMECIL